MTLAEYRRKLLRNVGIVMFCLYLLALATVGWEWLSASLMVQNPQQIEAQVTGSRAPRPKESSGTVYYSYTIQGKSYGGSFPSGVLPNGTPVQIFCNPSYPWLSSHKAPGPQRDDAQGWMLVLTIIYAGMTVVAMAVVSMVSLPSQETP